MSETKLALTEGERVHLLGLLYANGRDGSYYGNPTQYWNRHKRLLEKLGSLPHDTPDQPNGTRNGLEAS
jgi:hypothetical protein